MVLISFKWNKFNLIVMVDALLPLWCLYLYLFWVGWLSVGLQYILKTVRVLREVKLLSNRQDEPQEIFFYYLEKSSEVNKLSYCNPYTYVLEVTFL